jgi:hypothetical protein
MNGVLKSIQLIIGILLGLSGLAAIAGGIGYYFFVTQMSTRPPKPIFAEERKTAKSETKPQVQTKTKTATATSTKKPEPPKPAEQKEEKKDEQKANKLPPEAYSAKVIWKNGLVLKQEPDSGSGKVGGVGYNEKVAIIKESGDKQWLLIRPENADAEGWVKAGNIERSSQAKTPTTADN